MYEFVYGVAKIPDDCLMYPEFSVRLKLDRLDGKFLYWLIKGKKTSGKRRML
jgi:hypothetical protein